MRILIIAATENEIKPFLTRGLHENSFMDILITGVGMVATAYSLTAQIKQIHYDLILNVGIAGAFYKDIPLGTVFRISQDTFSELGAEDQDQFIPLNEMGLGEVQYAEKLPEFLNPEATAIIQQLPLAKSITVNTVHGHADSIQRISAQFSPHVESMEGAAVFFVAKQEGIPVIQVRSISNYVEKRNKSNWNIPLAIQSLNTWVIQFTTNYLKTYQA